MKIAIVVATLTDGGAERVAAMWAEGFAQRGNNVSVLLTGPTKKITYDVPSNVTLFNVNPSKGDNKYLDHIRQRLFTVSSLHRKLKEINPDVTIGVMQPDLVSKALRGLSCKFVSTEHNSFERPEGAPPMSKQLLKNKYEYNKKADIVTVLAKADVEFIGNRLKNVRYLPNPLAFDPVEITPPKKKIILAVGRMDGWYVKGFDVLIKSWGKIFNKHPDWQMQIVGGSDTASKQYLQSLADSMGIGDQISLQPYRNNIVEMYREAAIFCLSSRYDGFGMVLIEAMSQGCACVACDFKGRQADILNNDDYGIICPPDNVDVLSEKLDLLISNDDLRSKLQKNAPVRSKYYKLDNIMDMWEEMITGLYKN